MQIELRNWLSGFKGTIAEAQTVTEDSKFVEPIIQYNYVDIHHTVRLIH